MKRIILVLALVLLIALPVFAQEVTVEDLNKQITNLTRYSWTGAVYLWPEIDYADSDLFFYSARYRLRMNFSYKDGAYGVFARFQWTNADFAPTGAVDIIKYAYAKASLYNNIVVMTGGIGVPYAYTPWCAICENYYYVDPFRVGAKDNVVLPGIDGIKFDINIGPANIGIMLPIDQATNSTFEDQIADLAIGGKVNIEGIGVVYVSAEDILTTAAANAGPVISAAFELSAVENLYAAAKFVYCAYSSAIMGFGVSASYSFGPITIADDFVFDITNESYGNDIAVFYFADTWDTYLGFHYDNTPYEVDEVGNSIFLYFNYYAGKLIIDPAIYFNIEDSSFSFVLYLTYTF